MKATQTATAPKGTEFILLAPPGEKIETTAFLVRFPLQCCQDGSFLAHSVRVSGKDCAESIGPAILSWPREVVQNCTYRFVPKGLNRIADSALLLAEKSMPVDKVKISAANGNDLIIWSAVSEKRRAGHNLRWEILGAFFILLGSGTRLKPGMGQIDRFYAVFVKDHPNPPDFDAFKKAMQEMDIRFARRVSGNK